MNRRATGSICAIAALALIAATPSRPAGAGPHDSAGRNPARTTDCVWHRHTKRILRHVRRHGKLRKIVGYKHWWTCNPVLPARLGVRAFENFYLLSRPSVTPGDLILEFNNEGEDPHNLNIVPEGSGGPPIVSYDEREAGQRESKTFSLQAGSYRLYCSIPSHEGMQVTLVVGSSA